MATAIHQYEDKLLNFAYGELPAPEASAVESHLKSCARCTQALDQIRGVRATMSALPPEPAPIAGLDSLLAYAEQAAARNAAAPRAGIPWWRRIVAPLAGACALTLVAVVAVKTQEDGLDLSAEKAALDAQPRKEAKAELKEEPAPVAAAPAPAPIQAVQEEQKLQQQNAFAEAGTDAKPMEPKQVAQKMKSGKASGAANVLRGTTETERRAKEDRNWDLADKKTAAKNNNEGYAQALGETKAPAQDRQQAQVDELGSGIAAAQKESKSRRESPADQDFGNARGGYQQNKKAEEAEKSEKSKDGAKGAPSGTSTASKPSAPPPPPAKVAAVTPAPAAEPQAQPAPAREVDEPKRNDKPSLGLSTSGGSGTGSSSLGTRSPSAYKAPPAPSRDDSDDETAARGTEDLAGRKRLTKDVESEQRERELSARKYLDSARAAGNNGNRQEEVKQSLMVLKTGVLGASRAEALNRLCTALEELGNEGQADKYCDALLVEFPTSAAAKVVANRRNNMQRAAPAPKASKTRSYDESPSEKAEPAKAAPAAADKPASAY